MGFLKYPLKLIDGAFDRILAALGAIGGAQLPAFIQHYMQRLGGHVDELQLTVNQYVAAARAAGMSLHEYVASLQAMDKIETTQLSVVIKRAVLRLANLKDALTTLAHTGAWEKPFVFMKHANWPIVKKTWENYVPNVPTDLEGLSYAAAGLFLVAILYQVAKLAFAQTAKLFKNPPDEEPKKQKQAKK
jgi:hypothetical protein